MGSFNVSTLSLLVGLAVSLPVYIAFLLTLKQALWRCAPLSRTLAPHFVWLLLIPAFHLFWAFVVVVRLSESLHNEFRSRDVNGVPARPALVAGLIASVLAVLALVPGVGAIPAIAGLLAWAVYWRQVFTYSTKLKQAKLALV